MLRTKQHVTVEREIAGKQVTMTISPEAEAVLSNRATPLVAEAEILFSCLIRKRLSFRDASPDLLSWPITNRLHVTVRPVLYELCRPDDGASEPKLVDFAVADIGALIPKTIHIAAENGELSGTFDLG